MFIGRPWPQPGEPLFTEDDTAAALALAEEERDTCRSCGLPLAICRDPGRPFTDYDVEQDTCQVTLRLAHFREGEKWTSKHEATKQATMLSARFREGFEPPIDAGLDLDVEEDPSE